MIMSRYRFGPYVTDRYRFRANVTQRYATLHQRYRPLQTVTGRYRISPLLALQALPIVIYRKTPLLVSGLHTFSKANFDWIKLPVINNFIFR